MTICTYNREEILSKIINVGAGFHPCPNEIIIEYSPIGRIIEQTIQHLNGKYENVKIQKYIIMPNHIHMIIEINKKGGGGTPPLQHIIGQLKSYTTTKYKQIKNTNNKIWQRNYYEHIIRNEKEYNKICEYMINNPIRYYYKHLMM